MTGQNTDLKAGAVNYVSSPLVSQNLADVAALPRMHDVFLKHLPTKQGHNYNPLFERHFDAARLDVKKVLEVGVEAGTSLRMWKDYFPNAEIVGFDIDPACKVHEEDRISVVIGDQLNADDLNKLPSDFDIIIDDGLHTEKSQLHSFNFLFRNKMSDRGIYVVEDVINLIGVFNFFNNLSRMLNYWPKGLHGGAWASLNDFAEHLEKDDRYQDADKELIANVIGVSIYRHIIFIDKGKNPQDGQASFRINDTDTWIEVNNVRKAYLANSDFSLDKSDLLEKSKNR